MKRFVRLLVIIPAFAFVLLPLTAQAQQGNAGQGLEISPPLLDLKLNPGQILHTTIRLRNVTTGPLVAKAQLNDFVAAGEDGQPKLLLNENEQSPYSIKSWLSTIPAITLQPKEQKPIPITITVPKNAGPGGHYGVVRFTGTPPGVEGAGVSLNASIGTLILVNVSGNVVEQANISDMYTMQNGKHRWLFEYGPVSLVEKIQNTGNTHVKPSGTVRVVNMLGKDTATFKLNENGGNVLPGSTRKFEQVLGNKFLIGRYKVQADVVYGSTGKIVSRTISFWVIPYKLILIIILIIVLLIFFMRRYNKHIIKKAQKKSGTKNAKNEKTLEKS